MRVYAELFSDREMFSRRADCDYDAAAKRNRVVTVRARDDDEVGAKEVLKSHKNVEEPADRAWLVEAPGARASVPGDVARECFSVSPTSSSAAGDLWRARNKLDWKSVSVERNRC